MVLSCLATRAHAVVALRPGFSVLEEPVRRAAGARGAAVGHMCVDHSRRQVFVPKERLDRTNVTTRLEEVSRKRVAEGVAGGPLGNAGRQHGSADGLLDHGLVQVVPASLPRFAVLVEPGGGEHPLPGPRAAGGWELSRQRAGQLDPPGAPGDVGLVLMAHALDVRCEISLHGGGKHRGAVLVTLAAPHEDLVSREIDVLHAQPTALEQP